MFFAPIKVASTVRAEGKVEVHDTECQKIYALSLQVVSIGHALVSIGVETSAKRHKFLHWFPF